MNTSNLENLLNFNWNLLKQALPSFERFCWSSEPFRNLQIKKFDRINKIYAICGLLGRFGLF
jgi:hypothetical protein